MRLDNCAAVTRVLSDSLDRAPTLRERLGVGVHLPSCPGCRIFASQLSDMRYWMQVATGRREVQAASPCGE